MFGWYNFLWSRGTLRKEARNFQKSLPQKKKIVEVRMKKKLRGR